MNQDREDSETVFWENFGKFMIFLEMTIKSLDHLNEQIFQFILTPAGQHDDLSPRDKDKLKSSMALMRNLLLEAQTKFKKMVEDNKRLATRIDSSINSANQQVNALKAQLADTSVRLNELGSKSAQSTAQQHLLAACSQGAWSHDCSSCDQMVQEEVERLREENFNLLSEIKSMKAELSYHPVTDDGKASILSRELYQKEQELGRAKEAIQAMKSDRKRLKSEKIELLNQLKQLYGTLDDKECELRDFIRNYEQRMRSTEGNLKQLAIERDESIGERWTLVKQLQEVAEYNTQLQQEVDVKDKVIKYVQAELAKAIGSSKTASIVSSFYQNLNLSTLQSNASSGSGDSGVKGPSPVPFTSDIESTRGVSRPGKIKSDSSFMSASSGYVGSLENCQQDPSTHRPLGSQSTSLSDSCGLDERPMNRASAILQSGSSMESVQGSQHMPPGYNHYGDFVIHSDIQLKRNKKRSKSPNSFSKIFGKSRTRKSVAVTDSKAIEDSDNCSRLSMLTTDNYQEKLETLQTALNSPIERWKASQVLAWLEIDMNMPMYGRMCADNIKSGKVLLGLSDTELDSALDLKSPLHRRKIRLAIEEMRDPSAIKFKNIASIDHTYVAHRWALDIGLPQYGPALETHLVDGRLLSVLTRRDLEKYLGVSRKFHQLSIIHAIDLLHRVGFNKEVLSERRQHRGDTLEPLYWTNSQVLHWLEDIDLHEYIMNFSQSGVHGAVMVLEPTFNADFFAGILNIPQAKAYVRRHLFTEFEALVRPARAALDAHPNGRKKIAATADRAFIRSYKSSQEDTPTRRLSFRGSFGRMFGSKARDQHSQDDMSRSFDSTVQSCDYSDVSQADEASVSRAAPGTRV